MTDLPFNLTGKIIRFVTIKSEGIIDIVDGSLENRKITGIGISLMECIQLMLNYTNSSPFIFVEDFFSAGTVTQYGYNISAINSTAPLTNSVDGKIAETVSTVLQSNKADIALGFFYFVTSRFKVASALMPLSNENFHLYFWQPKFTQFDNPFNRQFSSNLILAYLAILLISGFLIALLTSLAVKAAGESISSTISCFWKLSHDAMLWAVSTWCQQDSGFSAFDIWQISFVMNLLSQLSVLLYTIYCAVIIATLTQNLVPIRNWDHIFQYKYTFFAFGDTKDRLLTGNELNSYWNPPPVPPGIKVNNIEEYEKSLSIIRLSNTRHAHLDTADNFFPDLDRILTSHFAGTNSSKSRKICAKLSSLPVKGGGLQSGLYVRKGFEFRNEFNFALLRIRETGINRRLIRAYESIRFQERGCRAIVKRATYQNNLGMTYLGSMFGALGVAYLFTILELSIEHFGRGNNILFLKEKYKYAIS